MSVRGILKFGLFIAGLVFSGLPAAQAATFQWQSASPGGCCQAVLEISDEAFAAGAISAHLDHSGPPQALPGNPIVRFELTAYGDHVVFDRNQARGFFDFDMSVVGGVLTGQIRANDISTDTLLAGGADSWTVKDHHSDHPGDCFQAHNTCSGASGRWVLVKAPAAH